MASDYINIGSDGEGREHVVPADEDQQHEAHEDCPCAPILATGGHSPDWYLHAPLGVV